MFNVSNGFFSNYCNDRLEFDVDFIKFIMSSFESTPLLESLMIGYQQRSLNDHRNIIEAVAPIFSTLTHKRIKFLTFFIDLFIGPQTIPVQKYSPHSFVINFTTNSDKQQGPTLHTIKQKNIQVVAKEFAVVLDYQKYLNCENLGETSVEQELTFWQNSEYCCTMPRAKFMQVMREAKVINFSQNQCPYVKGQLITKKESGSGVYIVRSGTFSCYKIQEREIEAARFGTGHIFGTLQLLGDKGRACSERMLTVRCTSKKGTVYHLTEEIFDRLMRHYCELTIRQKQSKLTKLLPSSESFFSKSKSLSQNINKVKLSAYNTSGYPLNTSNDFSRKSVELLSTVKSQLPSINLAEVRQTASISFYKRSILLSRKIEEEGLRRTNYLSLRKEGPLKNYPLAAQKANYQVSQFREIDKLMMNNAKPAVIGRTDKALSTGSEQNQVWKRDMIRSFYRQTIRPNIEKVNDLHIQ